MLTVFMCHVRTAVYADGGICLDILQNQWSPIYDVSAILTSIQVRACNGACAFEAFHACTRSGVQTWTVHCAWGRAMSSALLLIHSTLHVYVQSLLSDPNPNSPANSEAARLYNENRCVPDPDLVAH